MPSPGPTLPTLVPHSLLRRKQCRWEQVRILTSPPHFLGIASPTSTQDPSPCQGSPSHFSLTPSVLRPRSAPPPAHAPLLLPHSPDRPPRASGSGTALDPAPGPFAREAREFRPGPEQPPRPPLLRLRRCRSEPQTGNPPGPPSSRSRRCSCTKNRNRNSPRPPRAPRAPGLFVGPARRRARALGAARLRARGGH